MPEMCLFFTPGHATNIMTFCRKIQCLRHFFDKMSGCLPLVVLAAFLCGCRPETPPDYTNVRLEKLLAVCAQLEGGDRTGAMAQLRELDRETGGSLLVQLLEEYEFERGVRERLNRLLLAGAFAEAADELQKSERGGGASVAQLQMRRLPPALLALQAYCQRLPFEQTADLAQALGMLEPQTEALRESPLFQEFFRVQRERLAGALERENWERVSALLRRFDAACCLGQFGLARELLGDIRALAPESVLFTYLEDDLSRLRQGFPAAEPEAALERLAAGWLRETAVAAAWLSLNRDERRLALQRLRGAGEPARMLFVQALQAEERGSLAEYRQVWQRWFAAGQSGVPFFLPGYLQALFPAGAGGTERRRPALGVFDVLSCVAQIASKK